MSERDAIIMEIATAHAVASSGVVCVERPKWSMEEIDAQISKARWWRDVWLNASDGEHDLKRREYKLHRSKQADLRVAAGYMRLSHTNQDEATA